ncbi:MAG: hypothetical protein RJA22_1044 [Verrucomicrobiota bacterium]
MKKSPKKKTAKASPKSRTATPAGASAHKARPARKTQAAQAPRKAQRPARAKPKSATRPAKASAAQGTIPAMPPLLLEGDSPTPLPLPGHGPGERYAVGGQGAPATVAERELPEAYGTQRLFLAARDPRWLYAHWDMTTDQLRQHNSRSADRHLVLRVYQGTPGGEPHREVHVHPESRNWFVDVGAGATRYVAELGYYRPRQQWVRVALSGATVTPPDNLSDDTSIWFASLPATLRSTEILELVRAALRENVPLREALRQLRAAGHPDLPDAAATDDPGTAWTPAQAAALAEVITRDELRRVWVGSLEITELLRRHLAEAVSSQSLPAGAGPGGLASWGGAPGGVSSPAGGVPGGRRGFWFNVNAELILYGATEQDARVTIAGRPIRLRPDGTFSYRFSLPDGQYALPAVAVSADGVEAREAALEFSRGTRYRGEVGRHPQDPALRPPRPAHVS